MTEDSRTNCDAQSTSEVSTYDVSNAELQTDEPGPDHHMEQTKSPGKKKKKEHIKRPMNAFMVWSVKQRKQLSKEQPKMHNTELSKRLGQMWKDLGEEEKKKYKEEADTLKCEHREKYPDYKYRPKRRKIPKVKGSSTGPHPFQSCSLPNGASMMTSEDCSSTSSGSPRMTMGDGEFFRSAQQMSPVSATPPVYWETGTVTYSTDTATRYPIAHTNSPYTSPYSPWKPQPPSPVDYHHHHHPPPPYHGAHTSPNYHESGYTQESTSDTADYFSSSGYPPNRDASLEECSLAPTFVSYEFNAVPTNGIITPQEYGPVSTDSFTESNFVMSPQTNQDVSITKTLGVTISSPPTPPISPQISQATRSFHPSLSSYCYGQSNQLSSHVYTGYTC